MEGLAKGICVLAVKLRKMPLQEFIPYTRGEIFLKGIKPKVSEGFAKFKDQKIDLVSLKLPKFHNNILAARDNF